MVVVAKLHHHQGRNGAGVAIPHVRSRMGELHVRARVNPRTSRGWGRRDPHDFVVVNNSRKKRRIAAKILVLSFQLI